MGQIQVKVIGITVAKPSSNIFMLILAEVNGERKVPIIIGEFEAKAIMMMLQDTDIKRPLIYDTMTDVFKSIDIDVVRVAIVKKIEEVYHSELVVDKGGERLKFDIRSSDAIAVALRTGAPIYVEEEILEEVKDRVQVRHTEHAPVEICFDDELEEYLKVAIDNENYERAQEIKREILRRTNGGERLPDSEIINNQ